MYEASKGPYPVRVTLVTLQLLEYPAKAQQKAISVCQKYLWAILAARYRVFVNIVLFEQSFHLLGPPPVCEPTGNNSTTSTSCTLRDLRHLAERTENTQRDASSGPSGNPPPANDRSHLTCKTEPRHQPSNGLALLFYLFYVLCRDSQEKTSSPSQAALYFQDNKLPSGLSDNHSVKSAKLTTAQCAADQNRRTTVCPFW